MAANPSNPFLLYRDGENREHVLSLEPDMTHASVGRLSSSDLVLDWDTQVSRLHAKLERSGESWTVVDDGFSTNGTFVNGERLSGRRPLNDGDALSFGATTVTYRSPGAEEQAEPTAAGEAPSGVDLSTTQRRVLAALCRPYGGGSVFANPPTDEEIAEELFLSEGAVRTHMAVLVAKFGVDDLPRDQRRVRLAEQATKTGVITDRDL